MEEYTITQRPPRADAMRSRWQRRNFFLENGFVKPVLNSEPEDYNPFNFYKTGEKDTESLHRQFANIDLSNDNEILKFYNSYGTLGLFHHDYYRIVTLPMTDSKYNYTDKMANVYAVERVSDELVPVDEVIAQRGISKSVIPQIDENGMFCDQNGSLVCFRIEPSDTAEKIEDFKKACDEFKTVLDLKCALDSKDYDGIKRLLIKFSRVYERLIEEKSNEEILSSATHVIIYEVSDRTSRMVTPLLQWSPDGTGISSNITWRCDTLLSSIYMMLFMDITNNNVTKKCANEKCQKYFEANSSRKDNLYCSSLCRNAVNVRKSREKQSQ